VRRHEVALIVGCVVAIRLTIGLTTAASTLEFRSGPSGDSLSSVPSAESPVRSGSRRISPKQFTRLALFSFIGSALIIISGAAVRLSGSGLGCPDWPTCYQHRLTAQASLHPLIEFSNRMVTIALICVFAATVIGAYLRSPRRKDLILLSWLLIAGVLADAVLGGIVVYTKLNAYLVSCHMLLSLAMLALAVVLHHRSRYDYAPEARADVASPATRKVAWVLDGVFILVLILGTATTGTGPHAGGSQGQLVAKRLPFALHDIVMAHSAAAVAFIGMVTATWLVLEASGAPARIRGGAKRLFLIGIAQGVIGFIQYATHLPAWLVELHVVGACSLTIGVVTFQLGQIARDRDAPSPPVTTPEMVSRG
jgi:cytochrome c oxidase assembly protein subunit 15